MTTRAREDPADLLARVVLAVWLLVFGIGQIMMAFRIRSLAH